MFNLFKMKIWEKIKKFKFLSFFLLLPMFWFVPVSYLFHFVYAAVCGLFVLWAAYKRGSFRFTPDPFLYWLMAYTVLAFSLDIFNGGKSFLFTAHLTFCLVGAAAVIFYRVGKNELIWLTIVGVLTAYVTILIMDRPFKDSLAAAHVCAVVMAMLIFRRHKTAIFIFIFGFFSLSRAPVLGLGVALVSWYLLGISKRSTLTRRLLLAVLIITMASMPFIVGRYFRDDLKIFKLSTSRSYRYQVLYDRFFQRGTGVFFPISNIAAPEALNEELLNRKWEKGQEYFAQRLGNTKAFSPHSVYLEFLFNYGIILAVLLLGALVFLETPMTWPILACLYVVIAFQSEMFAPRSILPFYVVYRIMYLEGKKKEDVLLNEDSACH